MQNQLESLELPFSPTLTSMSGSCRRKMRSNASSTGYDSEHSDYNSNFGRSIKPKKRFIWPDELHREFISAIFDVGLKTADPKGLMCLLPESNEMDPIRVKSTIQKMKSFRYQTKNFGHDLMQFRFNGSFQLDSNQNPQNTQSTNLENVGDGQTKIEIPEEIEKCMKKLTSSDPNNDMQVIAQCVEAQLSLQKSIAQSLERQKQIHWNMLKKVQELGLPTIALNENFEGENKRLQKETRNIERFQNQSLFSNEGISLDRFPSPKQPPKWESFPPPFLKGHKSNLLMEKVALCQRICS
mmetsp:Transcript_12116/g.18119  ORF Transcript_12116/g.18119 Transcript_12116/m.18119 type:complete len:297 (+) Transcript_12116:32-922(+)